MRLGHGMYFAHIWQQVLAQSETSDHWWFKYMLDKWQGDLFRKPVSDDTLGFIVVWDGCQLRRGLPPRKYKEEL